MDALPLAGEAGDAGPLAAAPRVILQQAFIGGAWRAVPAYERSSLVAGAVLAGPALVVEDHTATVVEADWTCRLDEAAALVLRRRPSGSPGPDPPYPYT
jgi:5-oxoprolinase (ATP-hydrolysing)